MTRALVYVAGVPWDATQGTDHRLVEHLHTDRTVLWVDPVVPRRPRSLAVSKSGNRRIAHAESIAPSLWRVRTSGPPAATRPGIRRISRLLLTAAISRAIGALQLGAVDVVCASPLWTFGDMPAGRRVFLATDDFVAGARLMGLSPSYVHSIWRRSLEDADVSVAVSPALAERMGAFSPKVRVLPNGCAPERFADAVPAPEVHLARPIAGLIGQLNERVDLSLLENLAQTGSSVLLVGPATMRERRTVARLDALAARPNVQWVGAVPYDRVPEFTAAIDVGLTPYVDDQFNRASFPLKTLEYLSAGLPVVSTDLPSARWLQTSRVRTCAPETFVATARAELAAACDAGRRASLKVAARHSWRRRADELVEMLDERN